MDCRHAEKLIQSYISDELEGDELHDFITHIRSCNSCFDELETYFTIDATLGLLEGSSDNSSYNIRALLEDNLNKKEKQLKSAHRQRVLSIVLIPVIIFLAVLFYFIVFRLEFLLSLFGV